MASSGCIHYFTYNPEWNENAEKEPTVKRNKNNDHIWTHPCPWHRINPTSILIHQKTRCKEGWLGRILHLNYSRTMTDYTKFFLLCKVMHRISLVSMYHVLTVDSLVFDTTLLSPLYNTRVKVKKWKSSPRPSIFIKFTLIQRHLIQIYAKPQLLVSQPPIPPCS